MKKKGEIYNKVVKRILDIVFSIVLLILLSPIYLGIAMLLYLFQGRPIIFGQTRLGLNRKKV